MPQKATHNKRKRASRSLSIAVFHAALSSFFSPPCPLFFTRGGWRDSGRPPMRCLSPRSCAWEVHVKRAPIAGGHKMAGFEWPQATSSPCIGQIAHVQVFAYARCFSTRVAHRSANHISSFIQCDDSLVCLSREPKVLNYSCSTGGHGACALN